MQNQDRLEYLKVYRLEHSAKCAEYRRVWRDKNKNKADYKQKQADYSRQYYYLLKAKGQRVFST